ncbi:MAG: PAS domain S-box protein [Candidatus Omnitrophica bacterium]|nr:PAS domain S-box protein [Candidatus Omnitrophota bacterium]
MSLSSPMGKAIIESSQEAIIGQTLEGAVTTWNPGAEELYGYSYEEIIGKSINLLIAPHGKAQWKKFLEALKDGQAIKNAEMIHQKKSGQQVHVALTISPIKDEMGHLIGASIIVRDITVFKQAEYILREREKWFRTLIENSVDLLMQIDPNGVILYTSPSVKTLLGYSVEERLGKNIFELIHPDDVENIKSLLKEILQKTMSLTGECRVRHKNGSWRWMEGTGSNFLQESSIEALVINCHDITERKQAEERFQRVVEFSPHAMIMVDRQGKIVLINKMAEQLFSYLREELIGQSIEFLVPQSVRSKHQEYREAFIRNPEPRPMGAGRDLYGLRKDGTEVPVEIGLTPVEIMGEIFVLASIVDITERKKTEERIQRYTQALQESNKQLEQFAFVASHDLQEPLRIVSSYVQLWAKKNKEHVDATTGKYIHYIINNVGRMQDMIQGLLMYSRLGKEASYQDVDMNRIFSQAVENLDLMIKKYQAKITCEELPWVWGNPLQLTQLFQNLISNAIKYCKDQEPQIRVSAKLQNVDWLFSIQDNGIGIEPQYQEQIFEIFRRLHTREEYPGTGIGLAICKKIVETHRGKIWVESQPGKGSTFFFTLPKIESKHAKEMVMTNFEKGT